MEFKRVDMLTKRFFNKLHQWDLGRLLGWGVVLLSMQPELTFGAATVAQFARNISTTFTLVQGLMTYTASLCGGTFVIIGMMKFKAYRDNPAQIPLSTPFVLISVGSALLFLPTVFELAGSAFFADAAQPGLPFFRTLNL